MTNEFRTSEYGSLAAANAKAHEAGGEVVIDTPQELTEPVRVEREGIVWRGACGLWKAGDGATLWASHASGPFPLVEVEAKQFTLTNALLLIRGAHPHSEAISVGATGYWNELALSHVRIEASGTPRMGTGIQCRAGLKATLTDVTVMGFGYGLRLRSSGGARRPNAWTLQGCTLLWNDLALDVVDARDCTVTGGTIEGNRIGVRVRESHVGLYGVHLESDSQQLQIQAGGMVSSFASRYANRDAMAVWVREGGDFHGVRDSYAGALVNRDGGRLSVDAPVYQHSASRLGAVSSGVPVWRGSGDDDGR